MDGNWRNKVLGLSLGDFWLYSFLLLALALVCFYFAFVFLKRARVIEDTPTSKIRSAAQGYVELTGTAAVMEGESIYAPISKKPCAWYKYTVQRMEEKHSRTVDSGRSDALFLLQGETGRCVIDPDGAAVTPTVKDVWYSRHYPTRVGPHNHGILSRLGARYRLVEERLQVGEPLYAIGMFKTVGGAHHTFNTREEVSLLLREWKQNKAAMLKHFDSNNDGEIDMQEWERARKAATQVVKKQHAEKRVEEAIHTLSKPKTGQPYLLSAISPRKLTQRYRYFSAGSFAVFVLTSTLTVWMLGIRL